YRVDKGFDHMKVGIAVPVQRMVQAEKSGIMFTVDPITNDRSKIVIEAGFGLGEAVVSGAITPDRYIVEKGTFKIVDKEINEQDFKIVKKAAVEATSQPAAPVQSDAFAPPPTAAAEPFENASSEVPAPEAPVEASIPPVPAANNAGNSGDVLAELQNQIEAKQEEPKIEISQTPADAAPETPAKPEAAPAVANPNQNAQQGQQFIINEDELKADLEAIKSTYQNNSVTDDASDDQTVTYSALSKRSLTFTFSGDPVAGAVDTGAAAVVAPQIGETMEGEDNPNVNVKLSPQEANAQKLTDEEIVALAKLGAQVEEHYQYPQDTEWAIEGGQLFLVQARPVTTLDDEPGSPPAPVESSEPPTTSDGQAPTIILKGGGASVGSAAGPVKIIHSPSEIDKILDGDILVTEMTTPDYVPAMKRAAAIITDTGGRTCHAAIVSRELGIPCVVGTKEATKTLQLGQIVTVNGTHGIVYEGEILPVKKAIEKQIYSGTQMAPSAPITATKVYVNLAAKELAQEVSERMVDGVGLLRAEFMIAEIGEHPRKMIKEGRGQEFVDRLTEGLRMFAEPFFPRPVIYRATDFKTNEYRNLKGGEEYEEVEENPMIGYRGCFRYISDPEVFNLEIEAIKRTREEFPNLHVMIPFVRTIDELREVKRIMIEGGLRRTKDFKLYMMVEVPSTVFLIDKFCDEGIDGVSIGSNDLTQLILGLDRDSSLVASEFDERDEAVMMALERIIRVCAEKKVPASICGQAPSVYPEVTEKLVEWGINSVSVNPDMIDSTRRTVASVERKMLLKKLTEVSVQEDEELQILRKQ
ncbi:MAG TPA: phosphoenolpyruvate synthase, partial [Candidatus Wirthbacteria bacterium]|nr:phosphoenolpyruvate synthase [Candidatus Wirthbacteria bacterium]